MSNIHRHKSGSKVDRARDNIRIMPIRYERLIALEHIHSSFHENEK